jgi:UDP-glucose 4-epimerase
MRVIGITGISGFIASHVADECLSRGYKVLGLDHIKRDEAEYAKGVELFLGDMRDEAAMMEFAAHSDGIIHLGGVLGTAETIKRPLPAIDSNIKGGLNFLEACNQYNLPGVNICVGNYTMNNPYSISKNMVERLCYMFNNDRGGRINQVRAVNCYGPRQLAFEPFAHSKVRKIAPSLICRALSGMPMELYGGGTQVSDMVYVGDVARALVNALEHAEKGITFDKAIEIGSVEHTTIREVAEAVNTRIVRRGYEPVDIVSLPMRPGERVGEAVTADTETLRLIGMNPEQLIGLKPGIAVTIDWFEKNEGVTWEKPKKI